MSQEINPSGSLNINEFEKPKLPGGLNVLTILTIIGCIIGYIFSIMGFVNAKKQLEETQKLIDSGKIDEMPSFMKGMVGPEALAMQQKMLDNKWPILILGLVATSLCLYGAIEMRKLKKQGYTFWLIGELLPFATTLIFIGTAAFSGFGLLFSIFPVIFIILYTVYRKNLIY
jgi:hypothetical protein